MLKKTGKPAWGRPHLTTGQVAKTLKVASRTVSKWFDSGKLQGHRLPPSGEGQGGDRRIPITNLLKFAEENGMDLQPIMRNLTVVAMFGEIDQVTEAQVSRVVASVPYVARYESLIDFAVGRGNFILPPILIFGDPQKSGVSAAQEVHKYLSKESSREDRCELAGKFRFGELASPNDAAEWRKRGVWPFLLSNSDSLECMLKDAFKQLKLDGLLSA